MQEKELEGIIAAIILAGLEADPDNGDCHDQNILTALRMTGQLQAAQHDREPLTDKLRKRYAEKSRRHGIPVRKP
jgi:hypothetical protein